MFKKQIPSKNMPKTIGSTDITPYWQVIKDIIKDSDILLEVLDARMPELSRNKELEDLVKESGKQLILILNKADLVNKDQLRINYKNLVKENLCFVVSSKDKLGTKRLRDWLMSQGKNKERFRIGVLGYPNTGKSSIINSLAKAKKAKVSAKSGTTHGPQWVNAVANLRVIDSPGVIPIKQEDEVRYALIASRNVEKIKNLEIVAYQIIKLFNNKEPLRKLYHIEAKSEDPHEIIIEIGRIKGFMKRKGLVEESRTAIQIIRDWQRGKLRFD